MRSAVWTVRSVDEAFFASDTIIGIKKEKTNKNTKDSKKDRKLFSFAYQKRQTF